MTFFWGFYLGLGITESGPVNGSFCRKPRKGIPADHSKKERKQEADATDLQAPARPYNARAMPRGSRHGTPPGLKGLNAGSSSDFTASHHNSYAGFPPNPPPSACKFQYRICLPLPVVVAFLCDPGFCVLLPRHYY